MLQTAYRKSMTIVNNWYIFIEFSYAIVSKTFQLMKFYEDFALFGRPSYLCQNTEV